MTHIARDDERPVPTSIAKVRIINELPCGALGFLKDKSDQTTLLKFLSGHPSSLTDSWTAARLFPLAACVGPSRIALHIASLFSRKWLSSRSVIVMDFICNNGVMPVARPKE
ncbi:hypothetical protein NPIL_49851 [Nephila pilipes]|uniref:Uncharacterized protein n=1 Tax=Nephila pilipes TaxID=299642 RepID=A0A8X6Q6X2_NEPPI|nr:hypothetical protein NPIL_49851 [Nephila pilipes]